MDTQLKFDNHAAYSCHATIYMIITKVSKCAFDHICLMVYMFIKYWIYVLLYFDIKDENMFFNVSTILTTKMSVTHLSSYITC